MQGFDYVERMKPFIPGVLIAFGKIEMCVVVDAVPRDNQPDGRHMKRRSVGRVRMAQRYDFQLLALKIESVSFKDSRRDKLGRKLARKAWLPEGLYELRLDLVLNSLDNGGRRNRSCAGEPFEQKIQTEEMVAVAVGNVNRREVLFAFDDPVQQFPRLLFGQKGIDKNRIPIAVDERDSVGHPGQVFLTRRDALGGAATLLGQNLPVQPTHEPSSFLGMNRTANAAHPRCVRNQSSAALADMSNWLR